MMLPSFVDVLPSGEERGHCFAIDLGGTNLRVAHVKLGEGRGEVEAVQIRCGWIGGGGMECLVGWGDGRVRTCAVGRGCTPAPVLATAGVGCALVERPSPCIQPLHPAFQPTADTPYAVAGSGRCLGNTLIWTEAH